MKADKISIIRILFLAANPKDTTPLRLDEESRAIDRAIRSAEFRDAFEIQQQWAVRMSDLQALLLRYKPHIVHFSGHGTASEGISFEDNQGYSHPVSATALERLFSILNENITCVVLSACHSEIQAQAIAKHVACVIGMSQEIGDKPAISFATSFYQALAYGKDIKTAFELGCIEIDMESLGDQNVPQLIARNVDPSSVTFIGESPIDTLATGTSQQRRLGDYSVPRKTTTDIIIVEDDLSFADILAEAVKLVGYTSTIATYNPQVVLKLAQRYQPRALLGTVSQFSEGGFTPEWFGELRKKCPTVRVIGLAADMRSRHAWDLFDGILPKPFKVDELAQVIGSRRD
jgi:hypothetical protein